MSNVVSITTFRAAPSSPSSRRVASIPSTSGMRTSIRTTSGRKRRASATASRPSAASPTTSMSSSASRIMRKPGPQAVASFRPRARLEHAAVDRDPLAHANEAVAAAVAAADALAVVAHGDLDFPGAIADEYLRPLCPRMLERVGEALLDEAVGGEVDAGGERLWVALDAQLDRQPGLASLIHQLVQVLEAWLGRERRCLFGPPEHADHPAHLRQSLSPRPLDDEESLTLALLLGPQEPAHR